MILNEIVSASTIYCDNKFLLPDFAFYAKGLGNGLSHHSIHNIYGLSYPGSENSILHLYPPVISAKRIDSSLMAVIRSFITIVTQSFLSAYL